MIPTLFDGLGEALPGRFLAQGRSLYPIIAETVEGRAWMQPEERTLSTDAFSIRGQQFFDFVADTLTSQKGHQKKTKASNEIAVKSSYSPKIALQHGDLKLLLNRSSGREHLYDLSQDPEEREDLISERPEARAAMRQRLERWQRRQQVLIEQLNQAQSP